MNVRRRIAVTLLLAASQMTPSCVNAGSRASASFIITADTFNSGVGDMASGNYRLASSLGDAIGTATQGSAAYLLRGGFRSQLSVNLPSMLNLISVFSRKVHGSAGTFDLPIDLAQLVSGAVTVEPRTGASGHTIVFRFDGAVTVAGVATTADVAALPLGTASTSAAANEVIVTVSGVPDNRRLSISLTGVNGSTSAAAAIGFLRGDVNGNRSVSTADASQIRARAGQIANSTNFLADINATGVIGAADIAAAKSAVGRSLP